MIIQGDVLDVLQGAPDEHYSAVFCDPPYALSSNNTQGLQDRLTRILPKIMLPNFDKMNAQTLQQIELGSVSLSGSELSRREAAAVVKSWVSVPERAINFDNGIVIGQKEISASGISARGQVPDAILVNGYHASSGEFLGDYVLYLGDPGELTRGNGGSSLMAEFFSSGFAVPVVPQLLPSGPSPLARFCSVVLTDQVVGLADNSLGEAGTASSVLADGATVNTFMLRFDLSGGAVKLFATYRASHDSAIAEAVSPKLIRTFPATGGLPPMFKPVRVGMIGFTADRTNSFYFHLWLPEKWADILNTIIPSGGFMGKNWDATLPDVEVWKEIYRVMKPGAVLMAFGGTRTWHRLAVNIEDAGFEMFDTIMWLYGSGFPKSTDIGKAIDKEAGQVREVVGVSPHSANRTAPTLAAGNDKPTGYNNGNEGQRPITAPATDAARTWAGYGTALKPAFEPILLFRKPRRGTYAQTAIEHGTGALWVDGCRVATTDGKPHYLYSNGAGGNGFHGGVGRSPDGSRTGEADQASPLGRWPANIILDEAAAAALDQMSGERPTGKVNFKAGWSSDGSDEGWKRESHEGYGPPQRGYGDTGGASRFFKIVSHDSFCALCDMPLTQKHGIMDTTQSVDVHSEDTPCNANTAATSLSQKRKAHDFAAENVQRTTPPSNGGKSEKLSLLADSAEKSLKDTPETNGFSVPNDAKVTAIAKNARHAKYAENLCDICVTNIAAALVAIKHSDSNKGELQAFLAYMPDYKSSILIQNLVSFAELWENTDIIPTTTSLSILFGSVNHAIEDYTRRERAEPKANLDSAPTRFRYHSKASRSERERGLEGLPVVANGQQYGTIQNTPNPPQRNHHPCVKPLALCEYLARLIVPPAAYRDDARLLVPFCGSGSEMIGAYRAGWLHVDGIDDDAGYIEIARRRIAADMPLFAEAV